MTVRLGTLVVAAVLVLAACGDSADVTTTSLAGDLAATATAGTAPDETAATPDTTTAPTTTADPGEGTVDDTPDTSLPEGLELDPNQPKPVPQQGEIVIGEVQEGMLGFAELAVGDLAERLGVAREQIEIVTAEGVVWPDSSLGCPQPDMAYLQVLTDGYRIVLDHDGVLYSYHGGGNRLDPFYCEQPAKPVQGAAPGGGDS